MTLGTPFAKASAGHLALDVCGSHCAILLRVVSSVRDTSEALQRKGPTERSAACAAVPDAQQVQQHLNSSNSRRSVANFWHSTLKQYRLKQHALTLWNSACAPPGLTHGLRRS